MQNVENSSYDSKYDKVTIAVKWWYTYKIIIIDISISDSRKVWTVNNLNHLYSKLLPLKFPDCRTFWSCSCFVRGQCLNNQPSPSDPVDWIRANWWQKKKQKNCWFFKLLLEVSPSYSDISQVDCECKQLDNRALLFQETLIYSELTYKQYHQSNWHATSWVICFGDISAVAVYNIFLFECEVKWTAEKFINWVLTSSQPLLKLFTTI